ncbi:MAG: YDG/SRA domain-containing protein [Pedobacter agri]
MPKKIIFGEINGIKEGDWFAGRREMMETSFHRNWGAGIDGNGTEGTAAIVLSGGYEDDFDNGNEIIYTGAGGNDQKTGKQVADQSWENPGNAGLVKSMNDALPVRVIRGYKHNSEMTPKTGYSYGGLYSVVEAWQEVGKSGFIICRFRLLYSDDDTARSKNQKIELDYSSRESSRKETTILRIIRESKIVRDIKNIYNYQCQICNTILEVKSGRYAEGAHIKSLGKPHNGEDNTNNLLCLCPNHHILFDKGSFAIQDNFQLVGCEQGYLNVHEDHRIDFENLKYHRSIHGYGE